MIFQKIVEKRKKQGRREDDALQFLIDQGDDTQRILHFVIGVLFAGQLNSGINAGHHSMLQTRSGLKEILQRWRSTHPVIRAHYRIGWQVPLEGWENDFPTVDVCLKESIRLQLSGTAFRRNVAGKEIKINDKEVIPPGPFVVIIRCCPTVPKTRRRLTPLSAGAPDVTLAYASPSLSRTSSLPTFSSCLISNCVTWPGRSCLISGRITTSASKPQKPVRLRYELRKVVGH